MNARDVDQDGPGIKPRKRRSHEIDPWYKRYARDFHEGTRKLSLEERGAYSDIIDLIFMAGGPIEDDDKGIAFKLCIDVRKWKRLRSRLLSVGKLYITHGHIHNARAKEVLDQREIERRSMGRRGVDRPDLDPDLFGNINDFNGPARPRSPSSDRSDQKSQKQDQDRSFEPVVIDGGKGRPAQVPRFVSEAALDQVPKLAPGWDRQFLLRKFLDWPGSKNAIDMDRAFLGWVRKFTKGKDAAHG